MIKGVQRRVVEVRLGKSKIYESACFLLRQGVEAEQKKENELIEEARAIVGALSPPRKKRRRERLIRTLGYAVAFLVGGAVGFGAAFLIGGMI